MFYYNLAIFQASCLAHLSFPVFAHCLVWPFYAGLLCSHLFSSFPFSLFPFIHKSIQTKITESHKVSWSTSSAESVPFHYVLFLQLHWIPFQFMPGWLKHSPPFSPPDGEQSKYFNSFFPLKINSKLQRRYIREKLPGLSEWTLLL